MFGVVPPRRTRRNEDLRDAFGVEIFLHGYIGRGADRTEHRQHVVLFDKLAGLFDRLGGRVGVIQGQEIDLASVDAALIVEHLKVSRLGARDRAIGRRRPTVGRGVPELDGGFSRAATAGRQHSECRGDERSREKSVVK
jgi:hypothetical protein